MNDQSKVASKQWALKLSALLLIAAPALSAQTTSSVPLPMQLATAQTIFVSNAGGAINNFSQQAYVVFYQSLLGWKHFQLTSKPAEADLIFELSTISHSQAGNHSVAAGSPQLVLNIRDAKTQTILWSFTEMVDGKNAIALVTDKNLSDTTARLVADMNTLLASPTVGIPEKKARFAQEKP